MPEYKTPGIYTEEIPDPMLTIKTLPSSLPVFVGYTQKAEDENGNSLFGIPKKISSVQEFEKFFGLAKPVVQEILAENIPPEITLSETYVFTLYYAVKSFFDNGGSRLFILAVGSFENRTAPQAEDYKNALHTLENFPEPSLLVFAEMQHLNLSDYGILVSEALQHCKDINRFFIADLPFGKTVADFRALIPDDHALLRNGAAYYPNLITNMQYTADEENSFVKTGLEMVSLSSVSNTDFLLYEQITAEINRQKVVIPPSCTVAAVYISTDQQRGIWKAPANSKLMNVYQPEIQINSYENGNMNVDQSGKSVNAIRKFSGKGTIIWGARTLAGNDNEFKYVNVVRFSKMLLTSIDAYLNRFVFETDEQKIWNKAENTTEIFLNQFWREGALAGSRPEDAYFVMCGPDKTMTQTDISNRLLILQYGIAPIQPAEFTTFRVIKKLSADKES